MEMEKKEVFPRMVILQAFKSHLLH
jgi:hypothetical protein